MSTSRSNESSSEKNERLQLDRTRYSLLRTRQFSESKDRRLKNDRIQHAISRSLESSDSREQSLGRQTYCRHHRIQRELESREQHDIRVTEQCDRYDESQGQRIERFFQLLESVSLVSQNDFRSRKASGYCQINKCSAGY
ncbi:hypothetical protein EVAR_17051_1 [Eumeta japonica]|uniref:Uncharacterized protein n=1 Tax=Eumeta variegata TaxID=151549 RepID=A0A4C1V6S0_EUMVA|nr:hypothetical protein EVAR_17051_1 [Eumeta japonica]